MHPCSPPGGPVTCAATPAQLDCLLQARFVDAYLSTAGLPDSDLIIRTSGERRLSGFLLWQAADSTLHFDDRLWPDYDATALVEALAVHSTQIRAYGG